MMQGTGELSSDGKTLTWNYTGTCPIQKKPIVVRQIETRNGKDSMSPRAPGIRHLADDQHRLRS